MNKEVRSALLLGASGLVGGHCLDLLLEDDTYREVVTLGRRFLRRDHPKLKQYLIDFDRLSDQARLVRAQDVFCCLGTTIKKAGSKEAFYKVDFTYPCQAAKIAAQNGAEQFLLVSALGANARSSVFYNRVKGEVESAIGQLSFQGVQIFRPSLLLGERAEFRLVERMTERAATLVRFLLIGSLKKYRPIEARAVASAMIQVAQNHSPGVNVYESDRMQSIVDHNSSLN